MDVRMTEHDHQLLLVEWFKAQFPSRIIYAIPNGGKRNRLTALKLKMEGVLAGVPDLCIPAANNGYHGLYIEMKKPKGRLTDIQKTVLEKLNSEGYKAVVCFGMEEAKKVITEYFMGAE